MKLRALVVAGLSGAVLVAGAATNISYSPTGTGPYAWETVENWYKAGEPYGQLPGSTDIAYLQTNTLANQTVVLNAGTTANLYGLYLGNTSVPVTLEVEDGATLKMGHSSCAYGIGSLLHVKSGGLFCINSFLSFGANGSSDVRLLIDEGGAFTNSTGVLRAPGHRNAKAVIENHGLFSIVDASVGVGFSPSRDSSCTGYSIFDNYGRVESDSHNTPRFEIGAGPYVKGYLTNRVDATVDLAMNFTVGGSSNGMGYVCNYGTFNVKDSRIFGVGGDLVNSTGGVVKAALASKGYVDNYGTMNLATLNVGNWRWCTGVFTNHANAALAVSGNLQLCYKKQAIGKLSLEEGSTTTIGGLAEFGMYGPATVTIDGDLELTGAASKMRLATYGQSTSTVTVATHGHVKGNGKGLYIAAGTAQGGDATFSMVGNAVFENPGWIYMATGTSSRATMTLSDNATIDGSDRLIVGCGAASKAEPQTARCELRDNAQITNFNGHIYIGANAYGTGELILADQAKITRKEAPLGGQCVYIAHANTASLGTLTLRGGTLELTTNSTVYVGRNSDTLSVCNGFIRGWGMIDRICKTTANASGNACSLMINCGAVVADGEGEKRDLDMSIFRKVISGGTNLSGTNGWYAINKGRLYYPCRSSGYVNLGDYYSRSDGPYYVNGVKFSFTGANTSTMRLSGQLYATDRDDIPEGLPEDDVAAGVKRLGVWRAGLFTSSFSERILADDPDVKAVAFTKATAKIRYDNFRLNELKDENGDFRNGQLVRLYRHTGTEWQIVTTLKAEDAETDHLISGELKPVDERWNMGFFAVVAVRNPGTTILIR